MSSAGREAPAEAYAGDAQAFYERLRAFGSLEELGEFARGCNRCRLRAGCRGVVFGEGDPHARLCLIGEGPGAVEDELGRPFVGPAGELLDRILEAAGFARDEVYISNVVLCRPPGNRVPEDDEIAACRPYLRRRLELMNPGIVVLLGATPLRALVDSRAKITQERGRWYRLDGRWVLPTYHPAFLLRNPAKKREVWEDFQMVRELYRRLYGPPRGAARAAAPAGSA
jgi:uracil-DNA glycosylase family 4